ncbi:hypothetical protein HDU67_003940, partial [Dinochytrium kinnereticum]
MTLQTLWDDWATSWLRSAGDAEAASAAPASDHPVDVPVDTDTSTTTINTVALNQQPLLKDSSCASLCPTNTLPCVPQSYCPDTIEHQQSYACGDKRLQDFDSNLLDTRSSFAEESICHKRANLLES